MKFRDFSKNLSDEIENLFATIGEGNSPEEAHRLDECVDIKSLIERVKHLEPEPVDLPSTVNKKSGA